MDKEPGVRRRHLSELWRSPRCWLVVAGLALVTVIALQILGRRWWCACGAWFPWSSDIWSQHNSQHLADPYSLTHLAHGLILFGIFALLPLTRRWPITWRLCLATAIEVLWEIVENTPWIINRYRDTTMALGYEGDTILNALGDVVSFVLGFIIAARIGLRWSLALFAVMEVLLLLTIRDNLTLNVIMLLYPIDAIRAWQTAIS